MTKLAECVILIPKVFFDFPGHLDVGHFEMGSGSVGQVGEDHSVGFPVVLVDDNDVGVLVFDGLLDHLLDGRILAPKRHRVGNDATQLLDKGDRFRMWVVGRGDEDFGLVDL